jgi:hypothetical protein
MIGVSDAIAAAPHIRGAINSIGGPKALVGRFLGFGAPEMEAGVPGWAWLVIGAAAGGIAVWMGREKIEHVLEKIR